MGLLNWLTGSFASPFEPTAEECIEHLQGFDVGFAERNQPLEQLAGATTRAYQQGVKAGQRAYQQVQADPDKYR